CTPSLPNLPYRTIIGESGSRTGPSSDARGGVTSIRSGSARRSPGGLAIGRPERQAVGEGRAAVGLAVDPDATAMGFDDPLGDEEAQPTADQGGLADTGERLEQLRLLIVGQAGALIADGEDRRPCLLAEGGAHLTAVGGVLDGVVDEVGDDLRDPLAIPAAGQLLRGIEVQPVLPPANKLGLDHLADDRNQIDRGRLELELADPEAGGVVEVRGDPARAPDQLG